MNFGTPSYLHGGATHAYGFDWAALGSAIVEGVKTLWDEHGEEITEYAVEKGTEYAEKKLDELAEDKAAQIAPDASPAEKEEIAARIRKVLDQQLVLSVERVRAIRGAKGGGKKGFSISNVFTKDETETESGWTGSVGALVLGAAVGGVVLWAFKKYGKRS